MLDAVVLTIVLVVVVFLLFGVLGEMLLDSFFPAMQPLVSNLNHTGRTAEIFNLSWNIQMIWPILAIVMIIAYLILRATRREVSFDRVRI